MNNPVLGQPAFSGPTAYEVSGAEAAPVVILIHGLGLCRRVFDGVLPALAGYRVVNYDLYGHGDSAPFLGETSLTVYAAQLAALMDDLGIAQAHIVGFSIGGMINRRFALEYGDRAASLAILSSPHDRGASGQTAVEERALLARDHGTLATMEAALQRWFTPDYLAQPRRPDHGAERVIRWRTQADSESYAQASWVLANGVRELIGRTGEITVPTLVSTGQTDPGSTPEMSRQIAAEIAGAELVIVPELKHLALMERPETVAAPLLDFLDRTTGGVNTPPRAGV